MVICLELGADLHMAQLMPLPLTVSCFSKIQIGFTSLVPAHLGSPGKRAVKRVCVKRVCVLAVQVTEKVRWAVWCSQNRKYPVRRKRSSLIRRSRMAFLVEMFAANLQQMVRQKPTQRQRSPHNGSWALWLVTAGLLLLSAMMGRHAEADSWY